VDTVIRYVPVVRPFLFVTGLTVGDDAAFRTGTGNDRMTLSQIKATDDVRTEAESGDDVAIVGFITGKRVTVAGGGGTDTLGINPATITGDLRIRGWENVSSPST